MAIAKDLALFPLGLVVYPKESLNLHIFEPRYQQLIKDCQEGGLSFGVPTFINDQIAGYGTEVKITSIEKTYEDGRMDIRTQGLDMFRILDFQNPWKDRLYAGGQVALLNLDLDEDPVVRHKLIEKVEELFQVLGIQSAQSPQDYEVLSFETAHKVGLSLEQKYHLLTLEQEKDRQMVLLEHLEQAIPIIQEMENSKERIRLNGHFKYFDPLNF